MSGKERETGRSARSGDSCLVPFSAQSAQLVTVRSRDPPVWMGANRDPGLLSLLSTCGSSIISVCLRALSA